MPALQPHFPGSDMVRYWTCIIIFSTASGDFKLLHFTSQSGTGHFSSILNGFTSCTASTHSSGVCTSGLVSLFSFWHNVCACNTHTHYIYIYIYREENKHIQCKRFPGLSQSLHITPHSSGLGIKNESSFCGCLALRQSAQGRHAPVLLAPIQLHIVLHTASALRAPSWRLPILSIIGIIF